VDILGNYLFTSLLDSCKLRKFWIVRRRTQQNTEKHVTPSPALPHRLPGDIMSWCTTFCTLLAAFRVLRDAVILYFALCRYPSGARIHTLIAVVACYWPDAGLSLYQQEHNSHSEREKLDVAMSQALRGALQNLCVYSRMPDTLHTCLLTRRVDLH